ncbi:MAG: hypothetical protein IAB19_06635 [Proteobacteria bacterium]|uniref:Uncharacterized protein n=1 Tax=Candidatus Avisuccinivibrio stercorigallinarum TaxID=2840704 RepID=A0A9D9DA89_9GAMM|nr:hypothetical protein [Candidatus Avisuccinivibrio stercorigallinarum]
MQQPELLEFDHEDFAKACQEFTDYLSETKDLAVEDHGFYLLIKFDLPEGLSAHYGQDFLYLVLVKPLQLTNTLKIFPRCEGMVSSIDCLPDPKKEIDSFYANINKPGFKAKRKAMQSFERLSSQLMSSNTITLRSKLDLDSRIRGQAIIMDSTLCNTKLDIEGKNTTLVIKESTLKDCRIGAGNRALLRKVGKPQALPKFIKVWDAPDAFAPLNLEDRHRIEFSKLTGVCADDCYFFKCEISCDAPDKSADSFISDIVTMRCSAVDCFLCGAYIHIGQADELHLEKSVVISTMIEQMQRTQNQENQLIRALSEADNLNKPNRNLPLYSDSFFFGANLTNCPFVLESMMLLKSHAVNSAIVGSVTRQCSIKDSYPRFINNTLHKEDSKLNGMYDVECKLSLDQDAAAALKDDCGISMDEHKYKKLLCDELKISMRDLTDRMSIGSKGEELFSATLPELIGKTRIFAVSRINVQEPFEDLDPALIEFHGRENEKPVKKDLAAMFAKYK